MVTDQLRGRRLLAEPALALVLGGLGMLSVLLQLFLPSAVGLADNGDGFRLMCTSHLSKAVKVLGNPLVVHYRPGSGCDSALAYFSSEQWILAPAVGLYHLGYGAGAGFDLRALGVVHALLYGAGLAALYLGLPGSRLRRALTVAAAALLLGDISFVTYFVSPYSEPATFLGLLFTVAAAAWYVRTDRRVLLALVLLTAAGVFLAVAKSQTFVFAVLVVPVLLLRAVPLGRWSGRWTGRLAPAVAALVLLGVSGSNLVQQPAFYTQVNVHNLMFRTLLPDSSDPAGALRQLGVPTRLVRYEYTGYFDRRAAGKLADPDYRVFQAKVSRGALITFLAEHPGHWLPMLRQGSRAAGAVRVGYLSNYQQRRSPSAFLAPRPDPTHELLAALGPASWPLLPLVWLAVGLWAVVTALRRSTSSGRRSAAVVCYLLAAGALSQMLVSLLGDGYYELVKHTVLSGYATALLLAIAVGSAGSAVVQRRRGTGGTSYTGARVRPDPAG